MPKPSRFHRQTRRRRSVEVPIGPALESTIDHDLTCRPPLGVTWWRVGRHPEGYALAAVQTFFLGSAWYLVLRLQVRPDSQAAQVRGPFPTREAMLSIARELVRERSQLHWGKPPPLPEDALPWDGLREWLAKGWPHREDFLASFRINAGGQSTARVVPGPDGWLLELQLDDRFEPLVSLEPEQAAMLRDAGPGIVGLGSKWRPKPLLFVETAGEAADMDALEQGMLIRYCLSQAAVLEEA